MTNTRSLQRLIERIEEFLDEYKNTLDADEVSTIDDSISIIDRIKCDLENEEENEEESYND